MENILCMYIYVCIYKHVFAKFLKTVLVSYKWHSYNLNSKNLKDVNKQAQYVNKQANVKSVRKVYVNIENDDVYLI